VDLGIGIALAALAISIATTVIAWVRSDKKSTDQRLRDLEVASGVAESERQSIRDLAKVGLDNISHDIQRIEDGLGSKKRTPHE